MLHTDDRQKGFALAAVLLLVAIATILGTGYLLSSTVRAVGSENLLRSVRARYLAESGLQHALYVLQNDPQVFAGSVSNTLGPYTLDESDETYYFFGSEDEAIPGMYYLCGEGRIGDLVRRCYYTVFRCSTARKQVSHGMMVGDSQVSLPRSLTIHGGIHSNGVFLHNFACVDGDVGCHGSVIDPLDRITGLITTEAEQIPLPDILPDYYKAYELQGRPCIAIELVTGVLDASCPFNDGGAISRNNVGGVLWLKPEAGTAVSLTDGVDFLGTIVVDGDLVLEGRGVTLTAVDGFPAVVIAGRMLVAPWSETTINGLAVTQGGIVPQDGHAVESSTTINGGLIAGSVGYDPALRGDHTLNCITDKCSIYDFGSTGEGGDSLPTVKLLEYQ